MNIPTLTNIENIKKYIESDHVIIEVDDKIIREFVYNFYNIEKFNDLQMRKKLRKVLLNKEQFDELLNILELPIIDFIIQFNRLFPKLFTTKLRRFIQNNYKQNHGC